MSPVEITNDPPAGGIYATLADCREYSPTVADLSDPELAAILDPAEHDIDSLLRVPASQTVREATGLKYDPAALTAWVAAALTRATCAQVEYRVAMGPDFFIRAQHSRVRGPDFTTEGELPHIGPKALRELDGSGLLTNLRSGSARVRSLIASDDDVPSMIDEW